MKQIKTPHTQVNQAHQIPAKARNTHAANAAALYKCTIKKIAMPIKILNYDLLFFDSQKPDFFNKNTSKPQWSVLRELREAQEASYTTADEKSIESVLLPPQNKTI